MKWFTGILLLISSYGFTQWVETYKFQSISGIDFNKIRFINENIGFILNKNYIFRTTDAGYSWDTVYVSVSSDNLVDMDISNDTIIVVGNTHTCQALISTDAGDTWFELLPNFSYDNVALINGEYFFRTNISSDVVALCNLSGFCEVQYLDEDVFVYVVRDLEAYHDTAYATLSSSSESGIYKTIDRGETWIMTYGPVTASYIPSTVCIAAPSTIYVNSLQGLYYKTSDYGITWQENYLPAYVNDAFLATFDFTDAQNGIMVGIDTASTDLLLKTNDGGNNWTIALNGDDIPNEYLGELIGYINAYDAIDTNNYWLVTGGGAVFHTVTGGGEIIMLEGVGMDEYVDIHFSIIPNPASSFIQLKCADQTLIRQITTINYLGQSININFNGALQSDVSEIPSGLYFTQIVTDKGKGIQKWIKQ